MLATSYTTFCCCVAVYRLPSFFTIPHAHTSRTSRSDLHVPPDWLSDQLQNLSSEQLKCILTIVWTHVTMHCEGSRILCSPCSKVQALQCFCLLQPLRWANTDHYFLDQIRMLIIFIRSDCVWTRWSNEAHSSWRG